jgi:single-strand DNA-binding protein
MNLNKVILIGNITKDVELKALPSGMPVVSFGLATNRSWKDAQGSKQETVEFHNILAFGKQADVIRQYCGKGDQLYIEGRLQTRSWETDGKKHYKTEIVVENFQFGKKTKNKTKIIDDETGEEIPDETPKKRLTDEEKHYMSVDEIASIDEIPF